MAKETQKEKIERLEKELEEKERLIKTLVDQISSQNEILKSNDKLIDTQKKYIEMLKESKSIIEERHNERGAGRKKKFSIQEKETIKVMRLRGDTIRSIAEQFNCSVGLIHKLIHEKE